MKNFEYAAPCSENEVLQLLSDQSGQTELLAGGTDLVGLMKKMIVTPDRVVNIMEVPTLKNIEAVDGGGIAIGATVTLDEVLVCNYNRKVRLVGKSCNGRAAGFIATARNFSMQVRFPGATTDFTRSSGTTVNPSLSRAHGLHQRCVSSQLRPESSALVTVTYR